MAQEQQDVLQRELFALLLRCGVDCSSAVKPHFTTVAPNTDTKAGCAKLAALQKKGVVVSSRVTAAHLDSNKSYTLGFDFGSSHVVPFARGVGFRYCCHKAQRLSAAVAYFRGMRLEVQQKQAIGARMLELKGPRSSILIGAAAAQAKQELEAKEQLLPAVAAWQPKEWGKLAVKNRGGRVSGVVELLESMDSRRFFSEPRTKKRYRAAERQAELQAELSSPASTELDTASPVKRQRSASAPMSPSWRDEKDEVGELDEVDEKDEVDEADEDEEGDEPMSDVADDDDGGYKAVTKVTYGVHRDALVLPLFHILLVGRRDAGPKRVYDLSVPSPEGDVSRSFVANGVAVHNCNNFSHEAVKFLTSHDMPAYITGLPEEALSSPLGAMLRPMIANMENQFKQQQGGGMGGAIPWSADLLSLPPLDARPDRYHSQSEVEAQKAAEAQRLSEQAKPIAGASTTILSPTTSDHPHHPHASLGLTSVSSSSKPLLSADKKTSAFWALIKTYNKKVPEAVQLTEDDRKLLEHLTDALGKDAELSKGDEDRGERLFQRLIDEWSVEQIFPVLGLLRVFVLRASVAAFYEDKADEFVGSMLSFVPTAEGAAATAAPMAAQAMALCVVANLFHRPSFAAQLSTSSALLSACRSLLSSPHQTVRVMAATILYSLSLCVPKDDSDDLIELTALLAERSTDEADAEVVWRELLALGHLMYGNSAIALLASSLEWSGEEVTKRFAGNTKISSVVNDINKMMQHEQQAMIAS